MQSKAGWDVYSLKAAFKKKKRKKERREKGDARPTYNKNIKHPKGRPTIAFVF